MSQHITEMPSPGRRRFLSKSLGLAALSAWPGLAQSQGGPAGLIIRQKEPENLEFPFASLDGVSTPNDRFYIRSHFAVPTVDAGSWKLRVEGAVEKPIDLTMDDLLRLPQESRLATLECAGNSRVFLAPAAAGVQWELGAVSTAEWRGVPLKAILDRAGVRSGAVEVMLEGADSGEIRTDPRPAGAIHYARSLPLARALQPTVLLAHQMNGQNLPVSHGFPLRAVVAGWYGMASVKWLRRIVVLEEPFQGYYQTIDYAYWDRRNGHPVRRPLADMTVKSAIARPSMNESVKRGETYRVFGAAWSGSAEVTKVEVSGDGGKTWNPAVLRESNGPYAWRLWQYEWKVPTAAGKVVLMSRATDSKGAVQPAQHNGDFANYMIHHTVPISVQVV